MDRLKLKQKILDACFEQQTKVRENLKVVMEEVADSAEEYGLPKDLYDSYRNQMMSKRDMFAQQLLKINEQVDILRRIDMTRTYHQIRFGAVVITDAMRWRMPYSGLSKSPLSPNSPSPAATAACRWEKSA